MKKLKARTSWSSNRMLVNMTILFFVTIIITSGAISEVNGQALSSEPEEIIVPSDLLSNEIPIWNPLDVTNDMSKVKVDPMEHIKDFTGKLKLVRYQPRHIHLSYGDNPTTEMTITWSTVDNPNTTIVEYGKRHLAEFTEVGSVTEFQDKGALKLTQYIHRVRLINLEPGQLYMYHCGSNLGWSEIFYFTAMRNGTDWLPHLAVYGDLGNVNAQSLTRLQRETHLGVYDAIIHVGDFAYDMHSENGQIGDSFMEQIQPIAGYLPYMVCPGNHEWPDNFYHYRNRFTMPGTHDSMLYSWNMGPIHFISISTEFYYFLQYGLKPVIEQYEWLENDLKEAQRERDIRPWIVTYGHRPMYCSNDDRDDCTKKETLVRVGVPYLHWYGLEDMFMKYGVDLTIWAHEHSYERLWPIYNRQVYNGSYEEPYRNPKALIHVTTGSAGCSENHDPFPSTRPDWSAFRSLDYGYSRLRPLNNTHLYFEQVSEDKDGAIIDSFTLIRDTHGPYEFPKSNAVPDV